LVLFGIPGSGSGSRNLNQCGSVTETLLYKKLKKIKKLSHKIEANWYMCNCVYMHTSGICSSVVFHKLMAVSSQKHVVLFFGAAGLKTSCTNITTNNNQKSSAHKVSFFNSDKALIWQRIFGTLIKQRNIKVVYAGYSEREVK
jgi:hypothetical protein